MGNNLRKKRHPWVTARRDGKERCMKNKEYIELIKEAGSMDARHDVLELAVQDDDVSAEEFERLAELAFE